ncbi:MAG: SRPBCC family protein [Nocardioides sp.]
MKIQRTVATSAPPERVFAYLSDFTNTTEWDPGTVQTERISGGGGVGTRYHNVSKFLGRKTDLEYTVIEHTAPGLFRLKGVNKSVEATDTMRITAAGTGSEVTYTAEFDFKGVAKYAAPLFKPALTKLGNDAEKGLKSALADL